MNTPTDPLRRSLLSAPLLLAGTALAGCGGLRAPGGGGSPADGAGSGGTGGGPPGLVVASAEELGTFNPVAGYGDQGGTPIYEGLLRLHSTDPEKLPELRPALAAAEPTPNDDLTEWRVPVREGVTFHDGSPCGAEDVVATYRAVLDPDSASPVIGNYEMIESVEAEGDEVVFRLRHPYVDLPTRLLLGIAPRKRLTGGPATESSLNREPIGTGPMRLAELTASQATLERHEEHWARETGTVPRLVLTQVTDEAARAQQVRAGEVDGTVLPPKLAVKTAEQADGAELVRARTADWRGVSLPRASALAQDTAGRMALNLAVDRQAMVDAVLGGQGVPAATPVSSVYGEAHEEITFDHDPAEARRLLEDAGWTPGPDGVRTKDGERASLTVAHDPADTVRRDLATAFADDLQEIGVEVTVRALTWDEIEKQVDDLAILLGGGDSPYSIDTQLHPTLHSPVEGAAFYYNPGGYGSAEMDQLLDDARAEPDEGRRAALYRKVQQLYADDPTYVVLAFVDHTYVSRSHGYETGELVVEPHAHGVGWGPWWNVGAWT